MNHARGARRAPARVTILATAMVAVMMSALARAQEPARPPVELLWTHEAVVHVPGLTQVTVLDETICRAVVAGEDIRFYGDHVGDTVALVWAGGERITMVVVVTAPPETRRAATLSDSGLAALGRGRVGSSMMASGAGSTRPFVTREYLDWQQAHDDDALSVHGFTDTYSDGSHPFNLSSFTVQRRTGNRTLSLLDFPLNLQGLDGPPSTLSQYGAFAVRGADYAVTRGSTHVELFGGSTLPSYFLSFAGTRYIGGAKLDRALSDRLSVFAAGGVVAAPLVLSPDATRHLAPFGLMGATARPSASLSVRTTVGISGQGLLADAQVDYIRGRFIGAAAVSDSAAAFPLNQVQLLTAGEASARATGTFQWTRASTTTVVRHTVSKPGTLAVLRGSSDGLSQNLSFSLPYRQQMSANLSHSVSTGSVLPSSLNTRVDGSWSTPLGRGASNTLQLGTGRNRESTELDTYREFTARDSASVPLPFGSLLLSFDHERFDPSTTSRIHQVVDALPSPLQDLFRLDPAAFLQTVDLPADIRQLLQRVQPTSTSFSIGGQMARGRLSITPTFGMVRDSLTGQTARGSYMLGYSATWQLTSSLQLRSALTNQLRYTRDTTGFERSNVFTIGIDKTLNGLPGFLGRVSPKHAIEGHVFRDTSVDGRFGAGKPGLPAVQVHLDDGRMVTTDASGYYRFRNVTAGVRHVSLDTSQFRDAVRVTTPSARDIEITESSAQVDFGIIDSARLIGTVFNDYYNDGNRQGDAPGLAGVTVQVRGERFATTAVTNGSGEYEIDSLPPGEYTVSASPSDLPADYLLASSAVRVRVTALSTAFADIPVRALRSISGRVLLRAKADTLQPLSGVTVSAGDVSSMTDDAGQFSLRGLPAGSVSIRVVPVRTVPDRLHAPFGVVKLAIGPATIESANIIITNTELVDYIAAQGGSRAVASAVK